MGVGETGQIIGKTGVGETGVGEMGVILIYTGKRALASVYDNLWTGHTEALSQ